MATTAPAPSSVLDQKLKDNPPAKWGVICLCHRHGRWPHLHHHASSRTISRPVHQASVLPYILLGVALLIALGFEFVNGFHDTANAVATVIYTHSLEPHVAVVWSGLWNFIGVLTSSGAVAFSIVALLPVELILKVSSGSGFAMVFALLVAAVLWNLATWWRGLPVSSSHTMIGSILGVGLANQFINGHSGTSGVDWAQVTKVFKALIFSPIIGFVLAAMVFFAFKLVAKDPRLYKAPKAPSRRPSTSAPCLSSPAPASPSPTAPTTDRRAWASSCSSSSAPCPPRTPSTTPSTRAPSAPSPPSPPRSPERSATTLQPSRHRAGRPPRSSRSSSLAQVPALHHACPAADGHRHPQRGVRLRLARQRPAGHAGQRPQPDVPDQRDHAPAAEVRPQDERAGHQAARQLQGLPRQIHQVHPLLGQGRRRPRARPRNHGRLEAHRRHRRRERSARPT